MAKDLHHEIQEIGFSAMTLHMFALHFQCMVSWLKAT